MGFDPRWLPVLEASGPVHVGASVRAPVPPPPAGCSEETFQAQVIALAEGNGFEAYHTRDSRGSNPGLPDLLLCRTGVLIAAELKVKRNTPTAAQRKWLALLATVPGVRARHWRPEDWPAIVAELTHPETRS